MSQSFAISEMGGGHAIQKPPHMQTQQVYTHTAKAAVVPASWGIGTFHQNNPIYNQRVVTHNEMAPVHRGTSSRQVSHQFIYSFFLLSDYHLIESHLRSYF